jgi:hypothetical protein
VARLFRSGRVILFTHPQHPAQQGCTQGGQLRWCECVCVCVCVWEKGGGDRIGGHTSHGKNVVQVVVQRLACYGHSLSS